jgi:hypothetical protein
MKILGQRELSLHDHFSSKINKNKNRTITFTTEANFQYILIERENLFICSYSEMEETKKHFVFAIIDTNVRV